MIVLPSVASLHFAVRLPVVIRYLSQMLLPFALLTTVPALVALADRQMRVAALFAAVVVALTVVALPCARLRTSEQIQTNEALTVSALLFTTMGLTMSLPLMGYGLGFSDAVFESISAVTTTGLSTLGSVDGRPASFLFVRAWLQWIGGLGIVVLALAVLLDPSPAAREFGYERRQAADLVGGTRAHARRALAIYLALTLAGFLALGIAGAGAFDTVVYTLAAVSTGGFAPHDGSLTALDSTAARGIVLALCFAGAVSFSWYLRLARRPWRQTLRDQRFGLLLLGCLASSTVLLIVPSELAISDAVFTAFSAQTTAGFSSVDPASLAPAQKLALIASMLIGGGLGSTAGGIKILRLLIIFKLLQITLTRASVPKSARFAAKLDGHELEPREVETAMAVVLGFAGTVLLAWFAFLVYGYAPLDALFDVVSAIGTVGLSTGVVGADLEPALRGVLCVAMLMGRLETVAIVVLVFPGTWFGRRRRD